MARVSAAAASRTGVRSPVVSFLRLALAAGAASFTALAATRAAPVFISAGVDATEHQLADGTMLKMSPGSSARVVREFSLWGGASARPRLIRWERGDGTVVLSPSALPFVLETRDAELTVSEGSFDLSATKSGGTRVKVLEGRLVLTAKTPEDKTRGVFVSSGDRMVAEPGAVMRAFQGTIERNDDVVTEEVTAGGGAGS